MYATRAFPVTLLLAPAAFTSAVAQEEGELIESGPIQGFHTQPARMEFDASLLDLLSVPEGFTVAVFAEGLEAPRMMAVHEGTVFVTRRDLNDVVSLQDTDGDGRADATHVIAEGLPAVHGVAVHEGHLYLAANTELYVAPLESDGAVGEVQRVIDDLPDAGQHPNRSLEIGADGLLYLSIGSTCNACDEPNPESATMQQVDPETFARATFAEGLRNTIGFDWHPETGELWGMDHQTDMRGDDLYPEELNRIDAGMHYGWPFCWGEREVDEILSAWPAGGQSRQEFCAGTVPMELGHQAHSAPMDLVFYEGDLFPSDYEGDAFVTLHGSWNRSEPVGYEVLRLRFEEGRPVGFEPFLAGFLLDDRRTHFGRPVGLAVLPDGSLLVSEDGNGVIYRVAYDD